MASSPMTELSGFAASRVDYWSGILRSGRQGLWMAVAGPNDAIGRARGFHSLGKNEGLAPRWLVAVLGGIAFCAPSSLPQPHDVGDLTGIFFSGERRRGEGRSTGRTHDL